MSSGLLLRVEPCKIDYINRIMEGYEYLGVVTTIDRADGLLMVRVTPDTVDEVRKILSDLPVPVMFEERQ